MSAAPPRVSVILPTWNRAHVLPRAIGSVLGQSFRDFELIVVDDGSTDGTEALVRGIADPRLVYLPPLENLGDAGARNRGIAVARGEWLAFQDSDDEWMLHKLECQLAYAARLDARVAVVGGTVLRMSGPDLMVYGWPLAAGADERGGMVDTARWVADGIAFLQTMLVRRSAVERLGGFATGLKARSDVELCFRMLGEYELAAVREPVAVVHETPGSLILDHRNTRHDLRYLLEQHHGAIARDARTHARYLYRLAHAELMCGDLAASRRLAWRAIRRDPGFARAWAYLALSMLGESRLQRVRAASQARRARRAARLP